MGSTPTRATEIAEWTGVAPARPHKPNDAGSIPASATGRCDRGKGLTVTYLVRIEERVYVSDEYDPGRSVIVPDVRIASHPGWEGRPTMIEDEIHEARVEIIDRESRLVVTVIELLMAADGAAAVGVDGAHHLTSPSAMADGRATMTMTTAIQGSTPTHRAMSVSALAAAAGAAALPAGDNPIT